MNNSIQVDTNVHNIFLYIRMIYLDNIFQIWLSADNIGWMWTFDKILWESGLVKFVIGLLARPAAKQ